MGSAKKRLRLDLRRIRSFRAVAEHGGFRAASDALGISQPTLSAHIAELEGELRVTLLSRTTRRVRLTRMGERFLTRARRALDDLELAAREIYDEAALERGRVVLVCTPTLATHAISSALRIFRQKFPAVAVELIDEPSGMVERRLIEGEADIGIAPKPERMASLSYQPLSQDVFVAVMPPGLVAAKSSVVDLADIASMPMISMMPGTSMRTTIEQAFAAAGLAYEPAFEVRNHSTLLGLAEAGLGVAILPESAVMAAAERGIQVVQVRNPQITRDIGIVQRRGMVLAPAAAELAKVLRRSLSKR
jgi:LysR family carnitine catabolism transcriptional activator